MVPESSGVKSVAWEKWRTLAEDVQGSRLLASSRERQLAEATLALLEVAEAVREVAYLGLSGATPYYLKNEEIEKIRDALDASLNWKLR